MIFKKIKKNNKGFTQYRRHKSSGSGFVILFAVTISAILLAVALGVSTIAFKEVKFGTSAKDTNDAFFAADSGVEFALLNDKTDPYPPDLITVVVVPELGSTGLSCAKVSIDKIDPNITIILSKGYNTGSPACGSISPNLIERELKVTY